MENPTIYLRQIPVNNGKTVYTQKIMACPRCGDYDLFLFPDALAKHADCAKKSEV